jgi:dTDP-4-amino-4,6-dideoxygalactose transaminase
LTFCATVNAILYTGATPLLADVGADGNLAVESAGERIGARTRALLPVHLAGLPCDMDALWSLARRHGLHVVEDAAHAAGSLYDGRPIGAADPGGRESDAVAFSFYATKNLTTGEGGAVTMSNDALADRVRALSLHGISRNAWDRQAGRGNWFYEVQDVGFKYNLTDLQAAIGIQQLRKLDGFIAARRERARWYHEALAGIEEIEQPAEHGRHGHSWHLYILRLRLEKLAITRAEFIEELQRRGIGTSVHFIPIPLHPAYAGRPSLAAALCPRAMDLYPRLVSLPLYPSLTFAQVARVAAAVKEIIGKANKRRQAVAGLETATLTPVAKS